MSHEKRPTPVHLLEARRTAFAGSFPAFADWPVAFHI
jgi:hypothetical protein